MSDQRNWLATHDGQTGILPVVNELVRGALANKFKNPAQPHGANQVGKGLIEGGKEYLSLLEAIPRAALEMDGGKADGPWTRNYIHPQADAADAKYLMLKPLMDRTREANREWGKMDTLAAQVATKVPGLPYKLNLLNKIVLLMHFGNAEGRERIRTNMKLSDEQVHLILKRPRRL